MVAGQRNIVHCDGRTQPRQHLARGIVDPRQEVDDPIMADLIFQPLGQPLAVLTANKLIRQSLPSLREDFSGRSSQSNRSTEIT